MMRSRKTIKHINAEDDYKDSGFYLDVDTIFCGHV